MSRPGPQQAPLPEAARTEGLRLAELAGPTAIAVTQPVLGPLGETPETFVAIGATTATIVLFGLLIALGPLLVVGAVALASRLGGERTRRMVQLGLLALLSGGAGVVIARGLDAGPTGRVLAGLVAGAVTIVAYRQWLAARTFLRFAAVAPVVLLGVFLFLSPVSSLVLPQSGGATAPDVADGEHPPVVMLVFDELPTVSLMDGDGRIDEELFPNLARMAGTSTWYRNATTTSPKTAAALPALLTGRLHERDEGRSSIYTDHPANLFSLLAGRYEMNVHQWTTDLCPPGSCPTPQGDAAADPQAAALLAGGLSVSGERPFATLVDEAVELWRTSVWPFSSPSAPTYTVLGVEEAADVAQPGLEFLASLDGTDGPRLDYLHAPVPHQPWFLLPSGDHYTTPHPPWGVELPDGRPGDFMVWSEPGEPSHGDYWAAAARSRHLLQLQWTDRLVGAVMDRLEDLGRWDDAVVVVTSDHGVSFAAGESLRTPGPRTETELAWVPLLIKDPGQTAGEVDDANVLLIDVLPTVAELAGLEPDWEVDGRSLVGDVARDDVKPLVVNDPQDWPERGPGDIVHLRPEGLAELRQAGPWGTPGDPLRVWRIDPHGDLIGRQVADLERCEAPHIEVDLDEHWAGSVDQRQQRGALRLWLEARVNDDQLRDVAVAIDGVVAGWAPTRPSGEGATNLGVLLAAPIVAERSGQAALYEIASGDGCQLAPLG